VARFVVNQPVATDQPAVTVEADAQNPLALGRHRFSLTVTDDSGNVSVPDEVEVIVADRTNPTAVLRAPRVAEFGANFDLDASRSFDVGGGRIARFTFTYLGRA